MENLAGYALEVNIGGGHALEANIGDVSMLRGADGITPTIGENGNWYLGETDTGKPSRGADGATGAAGATGATGEKGTDGKSAYAYAVEGGYTGTETEFAAKMAEEMPDKLPNPNALTFTGAVAGSYDGSAPMSVNIPTVPTKTSQLTNDSGFLTSHQSLAAYRTAAAQDEIDSGKVDKVTGKGLSTNDYTASAKAKVDAIPANPKYTDTVYDDTALKERVATIEGKESAWDAKSNFSGSYNDLTDKPTIPTALPNPNALTFTGAVTGSYDGSAAMTVNIPSAVTDDHINSLIEAKLGVIENGSY